MTWVLSVQVSGEPEQRRQVSRSARIALAAFEDELARLDREFVRTGGRPKPGATATAYLRARDRRRKAKATVTLSEVNRG